MSDPRRHPEDETSTAPDAAAAADPDTAPDLSAAPKREASEQPPSSEQPPTSEPGSSDPADGPVPTDAGDAAASDGFDLDALADADPRTKAELLGALVQAEEERDEYLDDLRRSHADFENYRRRVMRESASQRDAGKAAVAEQLLEVLDDLDRTLHAAEGSSDASLAKGIELVASKFARALQGVGIERVDATGVVFDPSIHEAVQEQPAAEPVDEPRVAQVLRPGYALGERTLRAAMVVVEQ